MMAKASAEAIREIAKATEENGGETAVNLKVAEQYIEAFGKLAKTGNTLIVPNNLGDMASMVSSVMKIVKTEPKK